MGAEPKHNEEAFVIREFRAEDAAVASEILLETREAANWSKQALAEFMLLPEALALMSERAGVPTGFVLGRLVANEAEVLNLAVYEECRRQGEGRALLVELLRRFAESGVSRVFLEVRESNFGAIDFYKGMGFRQSGRREGYYREPQEAALVYEWTRESTSLVPKTS
ncbi:MAG TPA: ribosomal protein S18-alanine N-acetyltransferase [Candidatus Acidoferrum sp.]|nr:ribosomal protein S18-alanine N-acetyltransferase [Candidatus Acidoferrum sp.]